MATVRQLSEYQVRYLAAMYRLSDAPDKIKIEVLKIGRVDETGDLIVEWKQFGKITTTKVTFQQPKYE